MSQHTVQKQTKKGKFIGAIHYSQDGNITFCGQDCTEWYVHTNEYDGVATCNKCNSICNKIKQSTNENSQRFIDAIYDDSEKRTCKNCKYYVQSDMELSGMLAYDCSANKPGQTIVSYPPEDFGCNRWEAKEQ